MKLVVFDCDGTIVDSQAGIVLSMVHAFSSLQMVPPTREATLSVVGLSLPEAFAVLAPDADKATRAALAERYKMAFRELKHDPSRQGAQADALWEPSNGELPFRLPDPGPTREEPLPPGSGVWFCADIGTASTLIKA